MRGSGAGPDNSGGSIADWLLDPIVFELPDRRSPDALAFVGHIPFVFWLVGALRPRRIVELGTHWGHSYFAMCQAVQRIGSETETYAVDTWQGDEHAGRYGPEVFSDVDAWNRSHFGAFSTLVRDTFAKACANFSDGSIDLLHIDGLHTYEAARADFDAWRPKMKDGGVVILHDTAERTGDFGVYRLFEEESRSLPTFGFEHSHGLGVLGVGEGHPERLQALFAATHDPAAGARTRDLFSALGRRIELKMQVEAWEEEERSIRDELAHRLEVIDDLVSVAEARRIAIEDLSAEAEHRRRVIEDLSAEAEHRLRVIEDLSAEAEHRLRVIEGLVTERDRAKARAADLEAEVATLNTMVDRNPMLRAIVRRQLRSD